jgi:hypothetical protein
LVWKLAERCAEDAEDTFSARTARMTRDYQKIKYIEARKSAIYRYIVFSKQGIAMDSHHRTSINRKQQFDKVGGGSPPTTAAGSAALQ